MASMTMTASFLGGSAVKSLPTSTTSRRGMVAVRAALRDSEEKVMAANADRVEESNGRRELMFAVAAAAACSFAKVAMADEPKRGTPEAKKKYGPVCVTMPTARICRN